MSKKQLQGIIVLLSVLLLIVLFLPTDREETTTQELSETTAVLKRQATTTPEETTRPGTAIDASGELPEQVILEGVFLSLVDGENEHGKTFKYLLLDDGSEVMRVDLRPLIEYSEINVIEKLGVERGDRVRIIGILKDGEFHVTSLTEQ